jgi:hypothetical protein
MKFWFIFFFILSACGRSKQAIENNTDIATAKGFIQAIFHGNFDDAELYIQNNAASKDCLKKYRFQYNQMITKEKKEKYKTASIIIEKEVVSDSISIIKYKDPVANTSPTPLKIIRIDKQWNIDFSYSCSGNL